MKFYVYFYKPIKSKGPRKYRYLLPRNQIRTEDRPFSTKSLRRLKMKVQSNASTSPTSTKRNGLSSGSANGVAEHIRRIAKKMGQELNLSFPPFCRIFHASSPKVTRPGTNFENTQNAGFKATNLEKKAGPGDELGTSGGYICNPQNRCFLFSTPMKGEASA